MAVFLTFNQRVAGSYPAGLTNNFKHLAIFSPCTEVLRVLLRVLLFKIPL